MDVRTVEQLDPTTAAALRTARLTYPEVGHTATSLPPGYHTVIRSTQLPAACDFATASDDLFHWQVHRRAGLRVAASHVEAVTDAVVVLGVRAGPLLVHAPCRVVYVVDEPRRRGFAYGTLPGHPESGEQAFMLRQHEDGSVTFAIAAFTRPATTVAKLAGPAGRLVQRFMTWRYLRAFAAATSRP